MGNLRQRYFRSDLRAGWGWGWGWLGLSLVSVLAKRAGGVGDQGTALTHETYLHVLHSMP